MACGSLRKAFSLSVKFLQNCSPNSFYQTKLFTLWGMRWRGPFQKTSTEATKGNRRFVFVYFFRSVIFFFDFCFCDFNTELATGTK